MGDFAFTRTPKRQKRANEENAILKLKLKAAGLDADDQEIVAEIKDNG